MIALKLILDIYSTKWYKSVDGGWGSGKVNGNYTGMIGMLNRKEVDVGMQLFVVNRERSEGADDLLPFYNFEYYTIIDKVIIKC